MISHISKIMSHDHRILLVVFLNIDETSGFAVAYSINPGKDHEPLMSYESQDFPQ